MVFDQGRGGWSLGGRHSPASTVVAKAYDYALSDFAVLAGGPSSYCHKRILLAHDGQAPDLFLGLQPVQQIPALGGCPPLATSRRRAAGPSCGVLHRASPASHVAERGGSVAPRLTNTQDYCAGQLTPPRPRASRRPDRGSWRPPRPPAPPDGPYTARPSHAVGDLACPYPLRGYNRLG